jgi:hypothetical protein
MSGVLIRCQHCGTTQATLGECEACHEGETRYYCPNHTPGLWLDGPHCPTCGARVGVPPVIRAEPPRAPRSPAPPRDAPRKGPPSPFGRRPARPRERDRERDRDVEEVWTGPIHTPPRGRVEEPGAYGTGGGWPMDPSIAPVVFKVASAFGCLRRLVMIIVILIVLAIMAFMGLFGVGGLLYGARAHGAGAADVAFVSTRHDRVAAHPRMQRFGVPGRLTVAVPARRSIA